MLGARLAKRVGVYRLAVLAVLFVPAIARGEPPSPGVVYATAAVCVCGAGVSGNSYGFLGWDLALGARVGDWWLRGALTRTQFIEGTYGFMYEPHAGVERRTYDNPHASAFFGLDVGMLTGSGPQEDAAGDSTLRGGFVMPRAGIEGGFEHVRIRFSIELVLGYGHAVAVGDPGTPVVDATGFMKGGNLELGFTVR